MYLAETFRPPALMQSDTLYGLGAGQLQRRALSRRNPTPGTPRRVGWLRQSFPLRPFVRIVPVSPKAQRMGWYQHGTRQQDLGWYQAVANIAAAGAQIYASKEQSKQAETAAATQRAQAKSAKELLLLESALTERKAQLANDLFTPKNIALAGGAVGLGLVLLKMRRKRR